MIKFGTGGWRAEIGRDFYMANIQKVALALALLAERDGAASTPVVIGYDRRFLSREAACWMAEVLAKRGVPVWFMNRSVPTPLVMFLVKEHDLHFGIEITASHNPSRYNGIKVIVREGRDAPVEVTDALEAEIAAMEGDVPCIPFEDAVASGAVTTLPTPFNGFIDSILSVMDVEAMKQRGLRILFDSMHGSSTYPLTVIFNTARCTVDQIHADRDAFFGGMMPAPTEDTLAELRTRVVYGGYDLGIAVDGDGDRLGIIDGNGKYISANDILVLLYWYLHEVKGWKGPVVRNMSTTHMLDAVARSFGETCYEVPVGFKHISSKIDEVDAVLGGESSGGLTVRGHIHGKDSVYSSALFVEMICRTGLHPSEIMDRLRSQYGSYVMKEANLSFRPEAKEGLRRRIMEQRELPAFGVTPVRVSYEDGCKAYFADDSFVVCRFSGTEPLLRIFAEGRTAEQALGYIAAWRSLLGV